MDQIARRASAALALGAGLTLAGPVARAQDVATLAGRVVHNQSKAGIPGAEVMLAPRALRLVTDSAGHFRFDRVPPGSVSILVRRLGFAPESACFEARASEDLDLLIELEESAQSLDTVTVAGRERPLERGKLAGFYERKRLGVGRFFDSELLDKQQDRRLGELITSRTPGSRLVRSLTGSMAWVATTRRAGVTLLGSAVDEWDLNRGADARACYPDVYLDGAVAYSFGRNAALFDINSIATSNVSAIEFYVGPSQIPLQYNKTSSVCGVLLIWTK